MVCIDHAASEIPTWTTLHTFGVEVSIHLRFAVLYHSGVRVAWVPVLGITDSDSSPVLILQGREGSCSLM